MNDEPISLSNEGLDVIPEKIPVIYIQVNGREEHEALIRDTQKCKEHGLDQMYEAIVYLKRWGRWLKDEVTHWTPLPESPKD